MEEEPELDDDELDEHLEDVESEEEQTKLKMPENLAKDGSDIEDYDDEGLNFDGMDEEGEADKNDEVSEKDNGSAENDVFAMARENNETAYANEELVDKIAKIEDEMMGNKKWQMKGEVRAKQRDKNSLLEEYVDFDVASKLPPKVTQEMTNTIEQMIK